MQQLPPSRSRACFIQLPLENCLNVAHATIFHEFQEGRGKNSNRDSRERERKFLACIFFLKHASFTAKYSYKLAIRLANGNPSKSKRKKKQRRNNIFDCFEPYPVTCSYFYLLRRSRLFLVFAAYWPSFQTGVSYRGRLRVYSEFLRRFAK